MNTALEMARQFSLGQEPETAEPYGCGHINETYRVTDATGKRWILQKINPHVFPDIPALMDNISHVTAYLREQIQEEGGDPERECLRLIPTRAGDSFVRMENGDCWRMYAFVENTVTLQVAQSPEQLYFAGVAFGRFQRLLAAYPAASLHEILPGFHDTAARYRNFERAVEQDACSRAAEAQEEIAFVRARREEAGRLVSLLEKGELPLRVTHNDTKLNNVLLEPGTFHPVCVVDLDTVMPGLSLYDFGDSIRAGASTAEEDETDLSKVSCDLSLFEAYTKGFLSQCGGSLTAKERELLPFGAKLMTFECGMRFLTDYLEGDTYFRIHRPGHNLDRCRTQFKLVADMEEKAQQMDTIVARS